MREQLYDYCISIYIWAQQLGQLSEEIPMEASRSDRVARWTRGGSSLSAGIRRSLITRHSRPHTAFYLLSIPFFLHAKSSQRCVCVYILVYLVCTRTPRWIETAPSVSSEGKKRHFLYTVRRRRKTKENLNKWGILLERERERISDLEIYDVFTARIKRGAALQEWWGSFQWRVEMKWHRRAPRHAAKDPPEGEDFSFPLFIIIIIIFPTFWMGDV